MCATFWKSKSHDLNIDIDRKSIYNQNNITELPNGIFNQFTDLTEKKT